MSGGGSRRYGKAMTRPGLLNGHWLQWQWQYGRQRKIRTDVRPNERLQGHWHILLHARCV